MKTLVYLLYGNRREYHLELSYSVLTAYNFIREQSSEIKIVLVTEEATRRNDLPVDHIFFTRSDFNQWTDNGDYLHAAKVHALMRAMDNTDGSVVLVDTDTWFTMSPSAMFDRIGDGHSLMHEKHSPLRDDKLWKPFLETNKSSVAGYGIGPDSIMFNSGIIGVDQQVRKYFDDALEIIRELRSIHPVFNAEQLAFSLVLDQRSKVNICPDIVRHYWGYERRFCVAQIARLFPTFSKEIFESYSSGAPKIGYPVKKSIDQLRARLKTFFRNEDEDYRFAYLAYLSALSSKDDLEIASAWANTALEVIKRENIDRRKVNLDFSAMRIDTSNWLDDPTRLAWKSYLST